LAGILLIAIEVGRAIRLLVEQSIDPLPRRRDKLGRIEIFQYQIPPPVTEFADRRSDIWDLRRHAVRITRLWEELQ